MSETKPKYSEALLCINCKHQEYSPLYGHTCLRNAYEVRSPVDGTVYKTGEAIICSTERFSVSDRACGMEARFFLDKNPTV